MTNLKMHRFAAALMTGLVACALCAAAPATPQVRVAVSSDAITLLPVHLAQTLGYYKEEGLDVTLSLIGSANQTLDALHDGSVNVALGTTVPIQTAAAGRSNGPASRSAVWPRWCWSRPGCCCSGSISPWGGCWGSS